MKRAIYDMGVVKKTKDDETFGAPYKIFKFHVSRRFFPLTFIIFLTSTKVAKNKHVKS
jgi:hypothetical protein